MFAARAHEKNLQSFRAEKDEFFRHSPQSPLTKEQRRSFRGLSYFPYNGLLRLELPIDRLAAGDSIILEATAGGRQDYRRAGLVRFSVEGKAATLALFQSERGALFLPVRDATSGSESYGAGRYCEPEWLDMDRVLVDFNYLYNPYCAYNEGWSCPLPPSENWLRIPLRAGEMTFHLS